jgi:hypothetical protein
LITTSGIGGVSWVESLLTARNEERFFSDDFSKGSEELQESREGDGGVEVRDEQTAIPLRLPDANLSPFQNKSLPFFYAQVCHLWRSHGDEPVAQGSMSCAGSLHDHLNNFTKRRKGIHEIFFNNISAKVTDEERGVGDLIHKEMLLALLLVTAGFTFSQTIIFRRKERVRGGQG